MSWWLPDLYLLLRLSFKPQIKTANSLLGYFTGLSNLTYPKQDPPSPPNVLLFSHFLSQWMLSPSNKIAMLESLKFSDYRLSTFHHLQHPCNGPALILSLKNKTKLFTYFPFSDLYFPGWGHHHLAPDSVFCYSLLTGLNVSSLAST